VVFIAKSENHAHEGELLVNYQAIANDAFEPLVKEGSAG
jgi:hypothetical protein